MQICDLSFALNRDACFLEQATAVLVEAGATLLNPETEAGTPAPADAAAEKQAYSSAA